jgi:hypothetical protein
MTIPATSGRSARSVTASPPSASTTARATQPCHDRTAATEPPAGFPFLGGDAYPPGVSTTEDRIAAFENGPTRFWYAIQVEAQGWPFGAAESPEAFIDDTAALCANCGNTHRPLIRMSTITGQPPSVFAPVAAQ